MKTSPAGIAALQRRESCRLRAYQDIAGVWTIGWGHSAKIDPSIVEGLLWTQAQCDAALVADLAVFEADVSRLIDPFVLAHALTQDQFDALVSFTYNVGAGNLQTSTLLRLLNLGRARAAATQFCRFCHVGGVYNEALNVRRADEALQFCGVAA